MLTKNELYYGVDQPLPDRVPLRAGPITMVFENGDLRRIRYGDHEILRRVYVAVRDTNWGTVPSQISYLQINKRDRTFRITFEVCCQQGDIDFRWSGKIQGEADGKITFEMNGASHSEFWRNRIGFCVLHPIDECAGQSCEIETINGHWERGEFPCFIAPHQPFKNIRAIRHEVLHGVSAEVRMGGDTFEMEDQRNWTDASFKTYCTPLELPFPVQVKTGDRIVQKVQIGITGESISTRSKVNTTDLIEISLSSRPITPIPSFGLGIASHGQSLTPREIHLLRALNLSHLRVDLFMDTNGWRSKFKQADRDARALGTRLEIGLHLSSDPKEELQAVRNNVDILKPEIARWFVFHQNEACTDINWVDLASETLGSYDPANRFGCGVNSNFTELNRGLAASPLPPGSPSLDFLVYAANPQVHAFDNLSLVENLSGLGETVRSAQRIAGDRLLSVSPVTLKPLINFLETEPQLKPDSNQLPASVDPRQMSLFGAGWTLGAVKYLAENSVSSVTFYETTGWKGVMESETGSLLPELYCSIPGTVFPMYHIFADLGEFVGGQIIRSISSDPLRVENIAVQKGNLHRMLVVNLEGYPVQIRLGNLPMQVYVNILDEINVLEAMQSPERFHREPGQLVETKNGCLMLNLNPYAIARIDSMSDDR